MTERSDNWSELQAIWLDRPAPEAAELARLRAQVEQERRRMRREVAAERVLALVVAVVLIWWGLAETGVGRLLLHGLAGVTVLMTAATDMLRRHWQRIQGETVASCRQSLRWRARFGLGLAWVGMIGGPLGVGLGLVLGRVLPGETDGAASTGIVAIGLLVLATGWVWSFREARRCQALLAMLDEDRS